MEQSSASTSWAPSPAEPVTPPAESGRRISVPADSSGDLHAPTKAEVEAIVESTTDPLNRWYRYPAARALLPVLGRFPITPNHVTYTHIVFGAIASGLVAFTTDHVWLYVAFALLEVRMILDCFDGVLARAKGSSSPFGRALDEIADTVALISLVIALNYRLSTGAKGVFFACVTLAFAGLCANAWDFYKRKLTTALRDNKDGILDEIRHKKEVVERGNASFLAYWGIYFDSFQFWLYDVAPRRGDRVSIIRSRVNDPAFRRFAKLLAYLSFDNGLAILHVGVITALFVESELVALGWAICMWIATVVSARVVLRAPALERSPA